MMRRARERRSLRELQRQVWGDGYFQRHSLTAKRRARRIDAGVGVMFVGVVVTALGLVADHAPATPTPPAHKVTLCHATDSRTNPYRRITVDVASLWFQGHNGHDGPVFSTGLDAHEKWGDIIPPFHYPAGYYDGKNWDDAGRSVFDDGCAPKPHCGTSRTCPPHSTSTTYPNATSTTSTSTTSTSTTSTSTTSTSTTSTSTTSTSSTSTTSTTSPVISTLGSTIPPTTGPKPTSPRPTVTVTTAAQRQPLAFTGGDSSALVIVGLSMFGSGLGLSVRRRRTRG